MRRTWLLIALAIGGIAAFRLDEAAAVRKVLDDQQAAWNKGDLDGYMAGYWKSPDLTFYSGGDIQRGWQATFDRYHARYRAGGKEMGQLAFSDVIVEQLGPDLACVRGRWKLKLKDSEPAGLYTLLMRKLPEGWRVVHDHTSVGEKPTP